MTMAEIVNLNRFRKAKAKEEAKAQADRNRVAHGRTKAEKDAARRTAEKQAGELDGKKLDE
jgi:hypothetical protein